MTNPETRAVAGWIKDNPDVRDAIIDALTEADPRQGRDDIRPSAAVRAGAVVKEQVEATVLGDATTHDLIARLLGPVDWQELGANLLAESVGS